MAHRLWLIFKIKHSKKWPFLWLKNLLCFISGSFGGKPGDVIYVRMCKLYDLKKWLSNFIFYPFDQYLCQANKLDIISTARSTNR